MALPRNLATPIQSASQSLAAASGPTTSSATHNKNQLSTLVRSSKKPSVPNPDISTPIITEHVFWESKEKTDAGSVDIVVIYMCSHENSNPDIFTFERGEILDQSKSPRMGGKSNGAKYGQSSPTANLPTGKPTTTSVIMNWLSNEDMLPHILPNSDIMGFGLNLSVLNSAIDFNAAASSVLAVLRNKRAIASVKPLVFIGHGFGAVVAQRLLSKEYDEDSFGASLRSWTAAVLLFALPFRGSTAMIKWLVTGLKVSNIQKFTGSLNDGSEQLQTIWRDFESVTDDPNIFVYVYLSKNASVAERKFRDSKVLSIEHLKNKVDFIETTSLEISDIAKFSGPKDVRFQKTARLISNAVRIRQLHKAAERGDEGTLRYLIDNSVEINLANKKEQNALHESARHDDQEFIVALLSSGIDIDHQDNDGRTALHIAVSRNDINSKPILEALLRAGADPWVKDKVSRAPDDISKEPDTIPLIRKLFARPPLVEGPPVQVEQMLTKKQPPPGDGVAACKKIEITATEIFYLPEQEKQHDKRSRPEKHLSAYQYINDFIYSNDPADKIFQSVRRKDFEANPFCRWYHIPANNMQWVEDIFVKLGIRISPWPSRYRDNRLPHSRCMNSQASFLQNLNTNPDSPKALAILIPYISYEEISRQQKVSMLINRIFKERLDLDKVTKPSHNRKDESQHDERSINGTENNVSLVEEDGASARKISKNSSMNTDEENSPDNESAYYSDIDTALVSTESDSSASEEESLDIEELKLLISAYLTHNPPLHPRRTLDQSYYHMLPNTSDRDKDQVVSRRARKEIREMRKKEQASHNILMVDQLWLWHIPAQDKSEVDIVITSFPDREGVQVRKSRDVDDLQWTVLGSPDLHRRDLIRNSRQLISRILTVCCRGLDRHQNVRTVEFLQMFQSTIGDAEEKETKLFEKFRTITKKLYNLHENHAKYQKLRSDKLKDLLNIYEESNALKEIKDVLDEIKMIKAILTDQSNAFGSDVFSNGKPDYDATEAKSIVESVRHNFDVMETHAKDVEKGLDHLLSLKQMQANLWEARSSREGAEETAKQGNTLIVFTIVTIIFLPLSFMASFFALSIDQFPHDDKGNPAWDLKFVCALVFGISLGVSIILLILAFNISFFFTNPWNYIRNIWLKRIGLQLVRQLRHSPNLRIRTKGYSWYLKLSKSLYHHEAPRATTADERHQKRVRWLEGLTWNIESGGDWSISDFRNIYFEETQGIDGDDGEYSLDPRWSADFEAARSKIYNTFIRKSNRRSYEELEELQAVSEEFGKALVV